MKKVFFECQYKTNLRYICIENQTDFDNNLLKEILEFVFQQTNIAITNISILNEIPKNSFVKFYINIIKPKLSFDHIIELQYKDINTLNNQSNTWVEIWNKITISYNIDEVHTKL